jgi:hypothetical protein
MYQDFSPTSTGGVSARRSSEVRQLVGRYPNLSEIETARLINLYRELSPLDLALMISDEELAPKLGRFTEDHRSKVSPPFRQYAALVAVVALGIVVAAWVTLSS